MTYSEAGQLLRRVYDQWDAVRKLREVVEKAAEAESYLGQAQTDVKNAKAQLEELRDTYKAESVQREKTAAHWAAEDNRRASKTREDLAYIEAILKEARAMHTAEIEHLTEALTAAKVKQQKVLEDMQKEASDARLATDKLVKEMEAVKSRITQFFSAK